MKIEESLELSAVRTMPTTLSAPLQRLLQAIQADAALLDRLSGGGFDALLQELVATGRLDAPQHQMAELAEQLQHEVETLLSQAVPLTDEQLEAVAAGRTDAASLLFILASSLSIGAADGAAFLAASAPLPAMANSSRMESRFDGAAPQDRSAPRPAWMEPALEIIKEFEGLELEAYVDAVGVVTIGWGTTRYEDGCPVKMGETITASRAEELLVGSILREYAPGVFKALPMAQTMSPRQQAALVSFTYNVGVEALNDSTLRSRLLNGEPLEAVIRQELPRWCFGDGGERLEGLARRRAAEVALFASDA